MLALHMSIVVGTASAGGRSSRSSSDRGGDAIRIERYRRMVHADTDLGIRRALA